MRFVPICLFACACSSPAAAPDAPSTRDAPLPIDAAVDAMPDAGGAPDLSCLGQPANTTAPDPLAVDGTVFAIDHYQVAPFAGASVTLHRRQVRDVDRDGRPRGGRVLHDRRDG